MDWINAINHQDWNAPAATQWDVEMVMDDEDM